MAARTGLEGGGVAAHSVQQSKQHFHVSPAHGTSTLWPRPLGARQQDPRGAESSSPHPRKLRQCKSGGSSKFRLSVAAPKGLFIARKEGTQ